MSNPYIQTTESEMREMLARVGAASIDELFADQVPAALQCKQGLDLPPALSEPELTRDLERLAGRNRHTKDAVSFLGGGIYEHFIPAAVGHIAGRSEFVTSYTPYQPEASQGTLQAFFEYQTLVARLFAMDVSNASLYDGASALGEALYLALQARADRQRIVISESLHPDYRELAATYLQHFGVEIVTVPIGSDGRTDLAALRAAVDGGTAAVVVQHPNYFGCLEAVDEIGAAARDAGALLLSVNDPVSLGLLAPPGSYDADIAVGEGQGLGLRPWLGGETLGLFTCKRDFMRRMPGRLVGLTKDKQDRRGFVLTLQTREQHIRRDKATSNICTNHAHNALRATIHLCLLGPQGLRRVARACARNTARLMERIRAKKAAALPFGAPVFKEFVVELGGDAGAACSELLTRHGVLAGVSLAALGDEWKRRILVAVTECRTDAEIDRCAILLEEYL